MQFRYRPTRAHGGAGRATRRTACAPAFQLLVRHGRTLTVDGLRADDDVAALVAAVEVKARVPLRLADLLSPVDDETADVDQAH